MEKQTNPNGKTNKPKQEKKKRQIGAKKKKTQTEKQTNPNGKTKKRQIGAYRSCGSVIGAVMTIGAVDR